MASILAFVSKAKGQSDYRFDEIKSVLKNRSNYSIDTLIDKLKDKIDSYGDDRDIQRRQCLWILCLRLFYEGWDGSSNRQRVLELVHEWDMDEAIFYEMKDSAETYSLNLNSQDKSDLDASIKTLIDLG